MQQDSSKVVQVSFSSQNGARLANGAHTTPPLCLSLHSLTFNGIYTLNALLGLAVGWAWWRKRKLATFGDHWHWGEYGDRTGNQPGWGWVHWCGRPVWDLFEFLKHTQSFMRTDLLHQVRSQKCLVLSGLLATWEHTNSQTLLKIQACFKP